MPACPRNPQNEGEEPTWTLGIFQLSIQNQGWGRAQRVLLTHYVLEFSAWWDEIQIRKNHQIRVSAAFVSALWIPESDSLDSILLGHKQGSLGKLHHLGLCFLICRRQGGNIQEGFVGPQILCAWWLLISDRLLGLREGKGVLDKGIPQRDAKDRQRAQTMDLAAGESPPSREAQQDAGRLSLQVTLEK